MIAYSDQRCGHASVKLRIFIGNPQPTSVTTSEESDSDVDGATDTTGVSEVGAFIVYCLLMTESLYVQMQKEVIYGQWKYERWV